METISGLDQEKWENKKLQDTKNLKACNDPLTSLLLLWQRAKEEGREGVKEDK